MTPREVLSMIELSQASYRKMIQNLIWASGNSLAVPLAVGVLAPIGFRAVPGRGRDLDACLDHRGGPERPAATPH